MIATNSLTREFKLLIALKKGTLQYKSSFGKLKMKLLRQANVA